MNRTTKLALSIAAAALAIPAALVAALSVRATTIDTWTDGASIRVPAAAAPVRQILWQPAQPLPVTTTTNTNASTDQYEPRFSADGTSLVFVRRRPGQNADLFTARWSPAGWSEPSPIDSINTAADELGPELSRDGQSLYFYSDRAGGQGGYDLWVSRASADSTWSTPQNLGPAINSPANEYGPALSPTGDTLYFSSDRPRPNESAAPADPSWSATLRERRARHDYDLYSADLRAASTPKPLTSLNTPADEGAPAISPAGDFLYFASDRDGGRGGFDLYRARLTPDSASSTATTTTAGPAENLGPAINSPAHDLDPALTSDGFRLAFSSSRALPSASSPADAATTAAPRYSLWSSVSREVFRSAAVAESAFAWSSLWPWLAYLALTLLFFFLLIHILRSEAWRRRFGQLGLVARCLIISLLIHAGLASLLTVWQVGSGIINLMQKTGGGTRVILASGSPGGSIVSQIRGVITSTPFQTADLPSLAPLAATITAEPSAAPTIQSALPELVAPPLAALSIPLPLPPAPSSAQPQLDLSTPPPLAASTTAALPAAPSRDAAATEIAAAPSSTTTISPAPLAPTTSTLSQSATVEAPLPSLAPNTTASAAPLAAPPTPTRAERTTSTPIPAPALTAAAAQSSTTAALPTLPRPSAAPQSEPSSSTTTPINPAALTAAPPVATPSTAASPSRVDLPLAPIAGPNTGANTGASPSALSAASLASASPNSPRAEKSSAGSSLTPAAPAASSAAPTLALPRIAAPAQSAPSVTEPALASSTSAARVAPNLPALTAPALGAAAPTSPASALVQINPPVSSSSSSASSSTSTASAQPLNSSPTAPERTSTSPSAATGTGFTLVPNPSSVAGGDDARLPTAPVTPVESFEQRAPEVRNELVEKMGGSAETERAVALALEWFARHQEPDGHWSAGHFDDHCGHCNDPAQINADAAMTGMVLLCYLGAGHTHKQDGPYQAAVGRALQWLINRQSADGDLRRGETMYGQTVSTVALCEALAMTRDPALSRPARRAVAFVLARATGNQQKNDRDTSVLGWLVFTVESARRAGIDVPRATFTAAATWLDSVSLPGSPGEYAYTKGAPASPAMTAEAMFVRQLLGHTAAEPMMQRSANLIIASPPQWKEGAPTYYWYYATLALFQHQGDTWKQWNDQLVTQLLAHQQPTGPAAGSWDPTDEWSRLGGRIYQTAVCTLSLEVYYRYRTSSTPTSTPPARP